MLSCCCVFISEPITSLYSPQIAHAVQIVSEGLGRSHDFLTVNLLILNLWHRTVYVFSEKNCTRVICVIEIL